MAKAESTPKAPERVKDYNALQDWMCSLGEPAASLIVATGLAAVVVTFFLTMKAIF